MGSKYTSTSLCSRFSKKSGVCFFSVFLLFYPDMQYLNILNSKMVLKNVSILDLRALCARHKVVVDELEGVFFQNLQFNIPMLELALAKFPFSAQCFY